MVIPRAVANEVRRACMRRCATVRIPSLTRRGEAQREEEARIEGRADNTDERAFGRAAGRTAVRERPVATDQTQTERLKPVERGEPDE